MGARPFTGRAASCVSVAAIPGVAICEDAEVGDARDEVVIEMRGFADGSAVMAVTDETVLWWVDGCAVMAGIDEAVLWRVRFVVEAAPRPGELVDMARDGLGWVVADAAGSLLDGLAPVARGLSVSGVGAVQPEIRHEAAMKIVAVRHAVRMQTPPR